MNVILLMLVLPSTPIPQVSPAALERHDRVERLTRTPPRPVDRSNQGLRQNTIVVGELVRVEDSAIVLKIPQSERQLAVLRQMNFREVADETEWQDGVLYKDALIRWFRVAPMEVLECPQCPGISLTGPSHKTLQGFLNQVVEVRMSKSLFGKWIVTRLRLPTRP